MNCVHSACHQSRLPNFGSLTFSEIGVNANGQAGRLGTPAWTLAAIELAPVGSTPGRGSTAIPSAIDGQGTSFTITWSRSGTLSATPND